MQLEDETLDLSREQTDSETEELEEALASVAIEKSQEDREEPDSLDEIQRDAKEEGKGDSQYMCARAPRM